MIKMYRRHYDVKPSDLEALKEAFVETMKMTALAVCLGFSAQLILQLAVPDLMEVNHETSSCRSN